MTDENKQVVATGGKSNKQVSESHLPKTVLELNHDKIYPGPKFSSMDEIEDFSSSPLRLPTRDNHPDYVYSWLSMLPQAVPNFHDAVARGGYTACTVQELPEMRDYVHNTMDNSLEGDKIVFKEMILCKIHKEDYKKILTRNHHVKPMELARDVYRNFWDKVDGAGSGLRRMSEAELRRREKDDSDDERRFSGPQSYSQEATGLATDGKQVTMFKPKFEGL